MSLRKKFIEAAKKEKDGLKRELEFLVDSVFSSLDIDVIDSFQQDVKSLSDKYSSKKDVKNEYERSEEDGLNYEKIKVAISEYGDGRAFTSEDISKVVELDIRNVSAFLRHIPDLIYHREGRMRFWKIRNYEQVLEEAGGILEKEGSVSTTKLKDMGIITGKEVLKVRRLLTSYAKEQGWEKRSHKHGVEYYK